jgi:hypothetical protein
MEVLGRQQKSSPRGVNNRLEIPCKGIGNSAISADTRIDEELLDVARSVEEVALAIPVEHHRDRLACTVRLHVGRRLRARADPADVVPNSWRAARGEFP